MIIRKIKINNFRCFNQRKIAFSPKNNIILGSNAIGKTSVLEAITCLSVLKSFRTSDQTEIIKEHCDYFYVEGEVLSENKLDVASVYFDKSAKRVKINNYVYKKLSDYVGFFNVVTFSALDFLVLKGTSSERRRMFDLVFCQISKDYLIMSNYYKKLLKDRNTLLKAFILENRGKTLTLIETVTEQMIEYGNKIIDFRRAFCLKISEFAKKAHFKISSGLEEFALKYSSSCDKLSKEVFLKSFEEDKRKGYTTVGPHRDDYIFIINNKNIGEYGSQGQQKAALLCVKIALSEMFCKEKNVSPIVLLDDVFGELDAAKQNELLSLFQNVEQVIMTTTTLSDIDEKMLINANVIYLNEKEETQHGRK